MVELDQLRHILCAWLLCRGSGFGIQDIDKQVAVLQPYHDVSCALPRFQALVMWAADTAVAVMAVVYLFLSLWGSKLAGKCVDVKK